MFFDHLLTNMAQNWLFHAINAVLLVWLATSLLAWKNKALEALSDLNYYRPRYYAHQYIVVLRKAGSTKLIVLHYLNEDVFNGVMDTLLAQKEMYRSIIQIKVAGDDFEATEIK